MKARPDVIAAIAASPLPSLARVLARTGLCVLEATFAGFAALVDRAGGDRTPDDAWVHEPAREDWL